MQAGGCKRVENMHKINRVVEQVIARLYTGAGQPSTLEGKADMRFCPARVSSIANKKNEENYILRWSIIFTSSIFVTASIKALRSTFLTLRVIPALAVSSK
jgi:hypothetical protein